MRLATLFCVLLALAGTNVAQSTNFPTGPQYLVNGSPMFLRSIATPSLSLSAPLASPSASENDGLSQSPLSSAPLPISGDLSRILWGAPGPSDTGAKRLSENPGESVSENTSEGLTENASKQENVSKNDSEIMITSAPPSGALPASILDTGVTGMTSAQSLRERGFGIPLGDSAAFWRTHKPHAARIYTNADIQRLHRS